MTDKPIMLVITGIRKRSPISIEMYKHMQRPEGIFETYLCQDPGGLNIERYIHEFLPRAPDYILGGMGCDLGTFQQFQNWDYIRDNKIKTIFQVGDHTQFIDSDQYIRMNAVSRFDKLWIVSDEIKNIPAHAQLEEHVKTWAHYKHTNLFYHPWSFDPNVHFDSNMIRDFDVFFSMTVDQNWFSEKRGLMYNSMIPLQKIHKIIMGSVDNKGHWQGLFGEGYNNLLSRSKIAMVDTSMRHYMTAKYLEAGTRGCLLMGDAPWGMEEVFNDETMAIIDYNNIEKDVPKQIEFYLSSPAEREKKTNKLKEQLTKYTHEVQIPVLERKLEV